MKYVLLIKYIKRVLWRLAEGPSYIEDAGCLKVKHYKAKLVCVRLMKPRGGNGGRVT